MNSINQEDLVAFQKAIFRYIKLQRLVVSYKINHKVLLWTYAQVLGFRFLFYGLSSYWNETLFFRRCSGFTVQGVVVL